jgi:hypothetical protein
MPLVIILIAFSVFAHGGVLDDYQAKPDQFANRPIMNDIKMDQFKNFLEWRLVTTRFRADTNELRYTYANPAAWKALNAGSKDYPNGAVFAKVSHFVEEDPAFTSSVQPSDLARIQFMVRNKPKYAETAGWGYAVFDSAGKTFNGEEKTVAKACAACHALVPERGLVFSQLMKFNPNAREVKPSKPKDIASRIKFETVPVTDVLPKIRKFLKGYKSVRTVSGSLEKDSFVGTHDEILPSLIKEAVRSKEPAVLINSDKQSFAIVFESKKNLDLESADLTCPNGKKPYRMVRTKAASLPKTLNVLRQESIERYVICQ